MPVLDFLFGRPGERQQREGLLGQGAASADFAGQGERGFGALGQELGGETNYLRQTARGANSVSAERLRQALQQNVAGQQAMAASAAPRDAAMAGIVGSRNAMQAGSAMAGQAAMAGIEERNAAQQALMRALLERRQQDMQAALQGRQNATGAYQSATPGASLFDTLGGAVMGAGQLYAMGGIPGVGRGRGNNNGQQGQG